ncbi:MAG: cbb3-type cytochrome c oxidase subunit II, partial [Bryobacteraceae bacterium]
MLNRADKSAGFAIGAALVLFFIGGTLTTVIPPLVDKSWGRPFENHDPPPLVDKSWGRPFENHDPAKGPTGKLRPYTELEKHGLAIYTREGCWYCHTQQTRTLVADTKRSGWRGVDSPISTPDEFVYDQPHMFGTKRTGPDLSRVGGKYNTQWHRTHFRNPRDLTPGSVMP